RLRTGAGGKILDFPPVEPVADAHLDLVEAVQDVELGQRQPIDSAGARRLPDQHRVEPAAAPRPPGHDAELAAALSEGAAYVIELFGWERALPHPRRIGLA